MKLTFEKPFSFKPEICLFTLIAAIVFLVFSCASDQVSKAIKPKPVDSSIAGVAGAQIPLWLQTAPGSEGISLVEKVDERSKVASLKDRAISNIQNPSLTPFIPAHPNGTAVVIIPGGAYVRETIDKEGYDVANWLAKQGITSFILKYRLPSEGYKDGATVVLADAQRAIRVLRSKTAEFKIDPAKIGVIGFSAGGHVAALVATRWNTVTFPAKDDIDRLDARPSFTLLVYPVVSMLDPIAHTGSRTALLGPTPTQEQLVLNSAEQQVGPQTPPTIILQSADDKSVNTENAIRFYQACKLAKVTVELHLFKDGGHGVGIRGAEGDFANWPRVAADWLVSLKLANAN